MWRALLDSASDAALVLGPDGIVVNVNARALALSPGVAAGPPPARCPLPDWFGARSARPGPGGRRHGGARPAGARRRGARSARGAVRSAARTGLLAGPGEAADSLPGPEAGLFDSRSSRRSPGHGPPSGALVLLRGAGRPPFTEEEASFARLFAERAVAAIRSAALLKERARFTELLRSGLLPEDFGRGGGVEPAGSYRPSCSAIGVGGDFYDVYRSGGETAVVLGTSAARGRRRLLGPIAPAQAASGRTGPPTGSRSSGSARRRPPASAPS